MVVVSFADIETNQSHCELLIDMRSGKDPKEQLQSLQKLYSYTAACLSSGFRG